MEFSSRGKRKARSGGKGASFWSDAKQRYADLFASFAEQSSEFKDLPEFTAALRDAAWELTETIAKRSWRNGVDTGRARAES